MSNRRQAVCIIFANDLAFSLSCELDSYADDSTLTSTKKSIEEINIEMNENCRLVSQWMAQNQLCLNSDKTHLMIVGTGQRLQSTGCLIKNGDMFAWYLFRKITEPKTSRLIF